MVWLAFKKLDGEAIWRLSAGRVERDDVAILRGKKRLHHGCLRLRGHCSCLSPSVADLCCPSLSLVSGWTFVSTVTL